MKGYRVPPEKLQRVHDLLQKYNGTKKFHNFTIKKEPFDPSSMRQMKSLECSPPFVVNDVEFCVIRIRGNSFMMHQIRRMVGLLLAVARDVTDESVFERAFSDSTVDLPTAPGLGLVLDQVHYDQYDRTFGSDGKHEKLTWEECDEVVREFRDTFIHSNIVKTEIEEEPMLQWLEVLLMHSYDVVPDEQLGQQRGLRVRKVDGLDDNDDYDEKSVIEEKIDVKT